MTLYSTSTIMKHLVVLDDDWKLKGACRGKDLKDFFYHGDSTRSREMMEFCHLSCSVRQQCLLWALYIPEEYGIWGGHNADERRIMRKDPRIKKLLKDKTFNELLDSAV